VLRHFGRRATPTSIAAVLPSSGEGASLLRLKAVLQAFDLYPAALRTTLNNLLAFGKPAVLHVNQDHFIVLVPGSGKSSWSVYDGCSAGAPLEPTQFEHKWQWDGFCLLVDTAPIDVAELNSHRKALGWLAAAGVVVLLLGAVAVWRARNGRTALVTMVFTGTVLWFTLPGVVAAPRPARNSGGDGDTGGPDVRVEAPIFDAGTIFDDTEILSHAFTLENAGSADLVIMELKPNCPCMVARAEADVVPPGGQTAIQVTLNVGREIGQLPSRKVGVVTNDPDQPVVLLEFRGERLRELTVVPEVLYFGAIPRGETRIGVVSISTGAPGIRPLTARAAADLPFVSVEPLRCRELEKEQEYLLKVRIEETPRTGEFSGKIRVPCEGATRRQISVNVRGELLTPVVASKPYVRLGLTRRDQTSRLDLWSRDGAPVEVLELATEPGWLDASYERVDGHRLRVVLSARAGSAPHGVLRGTLRFRLEHNGAQCELEIPVTGYRM